MIFGELLNRFGQMMRPGYAVMFDVTGAQRDELARKLVRLVELPAGDRTEQLASWLNSLIEKGGGTVIGSDLVEMATTKYKEAIAAKGRGELVLANRLGVEACALLSRVAPDPTLLAEIRKFLEDVDYKPVMLPIAAGSFFMGSDKNLDPMAEDAELSSEHELWLPEYYIAQAPITNEQYFAFVRAMGKRAPRHWENGQFPTDKAKHPVVCVSWYDAVEYCHWLSEITGKVYRLPTEAEWEKACGGTDTRIWPWGNEPPGDMRCNYGKGAYVKGGAADTTPVGAYPKGANDLLDMAGNVWEWTSTLYNRRYPYKADDGRENAESGEPRIHRGGSFVDAAQFVRCAYRGGANFPFNSSENVGFRVVMNSALPTASTLTPPPTHAASSNPPASAARPDLQLLITLSPDAKTLSYILNSLDGDYNFKRVGSVDLTASPRELLQRTFDRLSTLARLAPDARTPAQVIRELADVGSNLYDELFPPEFKQQYPALRERHLGGNLLITTNDPWIPWEIVRPLEYDSSGNTIYDDPPLCESFQLARWTAGTGAPAQLALGRAVVIQPEADLPAGRTEREYFAVTAGRATGPSGRHAVANSRGYAGFVQRQADATLPLRLPWQFRSDRSQRLQAQAS